MTNAERELLRECREELYFHGVRQSFLDRVDALLASQPALAEKEKDTKQGWDAFYKLRKAVASARYPNLTAIIRAAAPPAPPAGRKELSRRLTALVEQQANDEGLWFVAQTAPEAYLQAALRKLHAAVESAPPAFSPRAYT